MRGLLRVLGIFLALLLVFVLGFLSCIGAIVGAGYYAYTNVSVDKLEEMGIINIDTDQFLDISADVSLTALTIEGLVNEITELTAMGDTVSVDFLINRYGLKLTDEILAYIPDGIRELPLSRMLSADGFNEVLAAVDVSYIYQYIPDGILSEPIKAQLADKTFLDVVAFDLGYLLDGVCVGYVLGVNYELVDGEYSVVFADPENPTLFELLAPVEIGTILTELSSGGDVVSAVTANIGDVMLDSLLNTVIQTEGLLLSGLTGELTISDIIVVDNSTGMSMIDVNALFSGRTLGDLLDYTPVYSNDVIIDWLDANGEPVVGVMRGMAGADLSEVITEGFDFVSLVSDVYIGDVLEYRPVYDADGVIAEWVDINGEPVTGMYKNFSSQKISDLTDGGFSIEKVLGDDATLGEILGYTYDSEAEEWLDENGEALEGPLLAFADLTFTDISNSDSVTQEFEEIKIAEILGYKNVDGVWMNGDVELEGIMKVLADKTVGSLDDELDQIKFGEVMGYTYNESDGLWYKDGEEMRGIEATFADLCVEELSDSDLIVDKVQQLTVGELLGYELVDGVWMQDGAELEGIMKIIADHKIESLASDIEDIRLGEVMGYTYDESEGLWYKDGAEMHGVKAAFADLCLDELTDGDLIIDKVHELTMGEILGYDLVDGVWMQDGTELEGIMRVLADKTVGSLDDELHQIKFGEVMGYTYNESDGLWYKDGEEMHGVKAVFADLRIDELTDGDLIIDKVQELTMGEILGYELVDGVWMHDGTELDGIIKILADHKIETLASDVEDIRIGEIMGYDDSTGVWMKDSEEIGGVMAAFADLKINELSDSDLFTDKLKSVSLADALGYELSDGVWMLYGEPVEGIMAVLADKNIGDISTETGKIKIGEIIGYTNVDGKWYKDSEELSGVLAAFADLTVNEMSDSDKVSEKIKTVKLADALGYTKVGDVWVDENNRPIEGVIKTVADSPIGDVNETINSAPLGEILGYEKIGDAWYNGEEKLSALICKIADCNLKELNKELEELCVEDVFDTEDLNSGFLKLANPTWTLTELGGKMNDTFALTTMGEYYADNIITIDEQTVLTLDLLAPEWRQKTINEFIPYLIEALVP